MKLGYVMVADGFVGFAFGSALLWFPTFPLLLLDVETNAVGRLLVQLLGAALLGYAVATVAGGMEEDASLFQRVMAAVRLISESLSVVVLLLAVLRDSGNAVVWVLLVLYLVFGVGYWVLGLPVLRKKAETA